VINSSRRSCFESVKGGHRKNALAGNQTSWFARHDPCSSERHGYYGKKQTIKLQQPLRLATARQERVVGGGGQQWGARDTQRSRQQRSRRQQEERRSSSAQTVRLEQRFGAALGAKKN